MTKMKTETGHKRIPIAVYIIISALPAVLTVLFYALRGNTAVMDAAGNRLMRPIRSFLGLMNSVWPFSAAEILCTLAALWAVYHIIKSVILIKKSPVRLKTLGIRLLALVSAALYIWCGFCWLWGSAYYETGFAEKNGLGQISGITSEELLHTAEYFLERANALAPLVKRDADGHYNEDISEIFKASAELYKNLSFEGIDGGQYKPKPMLYSWLMSRTGFTGFYFAFTGEANINKDAPGCLIPATVAHELAHQRGVAAEEAANFIAIAACIKSDNPVYEYSGYLSGLIHLMNAVSRSGIFLSNNDAWGELRSGFCPELERDWTDNSEYWLRQKTVETGTGIKLLDDTLTSVTEAAEEAVTAFYDGYLKSYGQEQGIQSYGACVDLLVEWVNASDR